MKTTWTLNENSTGTLLVDVDQKVWKDAQEAALKELSKDLEVQGFRKGHVPTEIARKHLSDQRIMLDAMNLVANDAFAAGVIEHKIEPVTQPMFDIDTMTTEELTLKFEITVKPEVELGDYKGISIEAEDTTVTDEEIESQLSMMQEEYAELVVKEGEVADGDTVIMDFKGIKDGEAFEGGTAENYELLIGSGSFIPGFEEAMIGMEAGEEKNIDLSFPEDYHVDDLKGSAVTFEVKLHEVKVKEVPELNDDFVELLDEEYESLDALKASIREEMEKQKKQAEEDRVNEELIRTVASNASIDIPNAMIEEEQNQMFNEFEQRLQQQGMNFELYSQILNQSKEDVMEQMREDAELRIRTRLTLEKIAEVEELKVEDNEVEEEYKQLSELYNIEIDQLKEMVSENLIGYDILLRKAIELVQEARA